MLTLFLATALATTGQAQCTQHNKGACESPRSGSAPAMVNRDYGEPADTPQNRANEALRSTAACALEEVPSTARKLMDSTLGSKDEQKQAKSLLAFAPKCYQHNWPDFDPTALHTAVMQAFYRKRYSSDDPGLLPGTKVPDSFAVVPANTHGDERQQGIWTLGAIANCIVFVDPANVRLLVLGPSDVPEEQRRFDALRPTIGQCVRGDAAAKMTPQLLRGYLAWALLDRTKAEKGA